MCKAQCVQECNKCSKNKVQEQDNSMYSSVKAQEHMKTENTQEFMSHFNFKAPINIKKIKPVENQINNNSFDFE